MIKNRKNIIVGIFIVTVISIISYSINRNEKQGDKYTYCNNKISQLKNEYTGNVKNRAKKESFSQLGGKVLFEVSQCQNSEELFLLLSDIDLAVGDNRRALKHAKEAYNLNPNSPKTNEKLGSILILLSNVTDGLKYLKRSVELSPNDFYLLFNYCTNLEFTKNYNEAVNACSKAISLNEKNGDIYFIRGRAYKALKQMKKAEKDFYRAKELGSDISKYYSDEHYKSKKPEKPGSESNTF